jgi:hypothetical protein
MNKSLLLLFFRKEDLSSRLACAAAAALSLCVIAQALPEIFRDRDVLPYGDLIDLVYCSLTGSPAAFWFYRINEHLPFFAMPLYWADLRLFGAQGVFLTVCAVALAASIALMPVPVLRRALPGRPGLTATAALVLLASFLWFGNEVNLLWTNQIHLYVSLFAVMLAILLAARISPGAAGRTPWRGLAALGACLTVASFSFGFGIIGFPAVLALGAARRWPLRGLAALGLYGLACVVLYAALAAPALIPNGKAAVAHLSAGQSALHALTFVAGPLYAALRCLLPDWVALGLAWAATIAGGVGLLRHVRRLRRGPVGTRDAWVIALAGFTLLASIETTYARAMFGFRHAADSRYLIGEFPYWIALLLIALPGGRGARAGACCAMAVWAAVMVLSQQTILPKDRGQRYGRMVSAMALINDVDDLAVYRTDDLPTPERAQTMFAAFKAHGWSASAWPQKHWIGRPLASFGAVASGCRGAIDSVAAVDDSLGGHGGRRVQGWAVSDARGDADPWVLLTDRAGMVRGLAHGGGPRPDVAAALGRPALSSAGWTGYVPLSVQPSAVTAYLLVKTKHPCLAAGPAPR